MKSRGILEKRVFLLSDPPKVWVKALNAEDTMATIGPNFNKIQMRNDAAALKDAKTVDSKEAMQGLTKNVSLKDTKKTDKNEGVKRQDGIDFRTLQKLDEAEQAEKNKDSQKAGAESNIDEAAQQNVKKKDIGRKDEDDLKVGKGETKEVKEGYVRVEGTDEDDGYEIKEADKNKLDRMDLDSQREKILGDMPSHVREASTKMVMNQIDKDGPEKVSNMKEGKPEFNEAVEGMELANTEDVQESGSIPAEIKSPESKDFKPLMLEDPHADETMKRAALEQAKNGGGQEAMIAS